MTVLLIGTYEMGRQPFGLASPAAWLRDAGHTVLLCDLSRAALDAAVVAASDVVAWYLPMHTATRLLPPVVAAVRRINPTAHLCAFGLYAPLNNAQLRALGVGSVLGPEFEAELLDVVERVDAARASSAAQGARMPTLPVNEAEGTGVRAVPAYPEAEGTGVPAMPGYPEAEASGLRGRGHRFAVPRLTFRAPDRTGLPPLERYARLRVGDDRRLVGYTEATRGCKHRCRHCPIVPVYDGRFRVVDVAVVMADVSRQVAAGARHITFGDPDFLNGPRHATAVVDALHAAHPDLTYDVTIKVEHLLARADVLPRLRDTGCLFVTSAVESFDDGILGRLDKGHTRHDAERAIATCRAVGLPLVPTFVAFTPWTTKEIYANLLRACAALDLADAVAPVQLTIRLLVTEGSRLLELADLRASLAAFDHDSLVYPWRHPDPEMDGLHTELTALVGRRLTSSRRDVFHDVWQRVRHRWPHLLPLEPFEPGIVAVRAAVPWLDEPWYC